MASYQRRAENRAEKLTGENYTVPGADPTRNPAFCAVYAGVVLVHGGTKLVLNIHRGWVGERRPPPPLRLAEPRRGLTALSLRG